MQDGLPAVVGSGEEEQVREIVSGEDLSLAVLSGYEQAELARRPIAQGVGLHEGGEHVFLPRVERHAAQSAEPQRDTGPGTGGFRPFLDSRAFRSVQRLLIRRRAHRTGHPPRLYGPTGWPDGRRPPHGS